MLKMRLMYHTHGFIMAMMGMREPYKTTDKGDSRFNNRFEEVGPKDLELAKRLALAGPTHAKYRRMIQVWVEVTAPLYWWKEFDTYKVGTVANSESTMHTIAAREFTMDDFSCEHLMEYAAPGVSSVPLVVVGQDDILSPLGITRCLVTLLNKCRQLYLDTKDKKYWWQMIQLLPSSYNQTRMICLNYEVLAHIYEDRRNHKLDEWHTFCEWIEELPHAKEMIFPEKEEAEDPKRIYTIRKDALRQFVGYLADVNTSKDIAKFIGIPESLVRMLLLDLGMEAKGEDTNQS